MVPTSPGMAVVVVQIVHDPAAYLEDVKFSLAQKSGIEPENRRLIFTPAVGVVPGDLLAEQGNGRQPFLACSGASDTLSGLHDWQVCHKRRTICMQLHVILQHLCIHIYVMILHSRACESAHICTMGVQASQLELTMPTAPG
jgi:hypothetical protein